MKPQNITQHQRRVRLFFLFLIGAALAAGCAPTGTATATAAAIKPSVTLIPSTTPVLETPLPPTSTPTPVATATLAASPTPALPQASAMPSELLTTLTATATWIPVSNGKAQVPILTYHHVSDTGQPNSRYYVKVSDFRDQMEALRRLGRNAITLSALVKALHGGSLPENPVIITFDDGDLDVYQNAFPIMRDLGFPGVFFIISSALHAENFVGIDQLKEMAAAGWEIGSHSRTHANLTKDGVDAMREMAGSRDELEQALGMQVVSFAYPYNASNKSINQGAHTAGYADAACSGWSNQQSLANLYCLSRREVKGSLSLEQFIELIQGP